MEQLLTSIIDISKFKIIQIIDTGNRTFDNLLQTFLITLITILISKVCFKNISYRIFKPTKITTHNKDFYKKYIEEHLDDFKSFTWILDENKDFSLRLNKYLSVNNCLNDLDGSIYPDFYDLSTFSLKEKELNTDLIDRFYNYKIPEKQFIPIYVNGLDIVGILNKKTGNLIFYNSEKIIKKFLELLKNMKCNLINNNLSTKNLYVHSNISCKTTASIINKDKNMDNFVSRHKQKILKHLDTFKNINDGKILFGNFCSKNLGIILYGPPGTGKSMLIPSICNYLNRDAYIIDMKKIKTKKEFVQLFEDCKKYVIVLDEFDIILDVIKDRSVKEESKKDNSLSQLTKNKFKLMELMNSSTSTSTDLKKELESINKEIGYKEDQLSLDTILQVLQGVEEYQNRIIIATTNYISKIDSALLRPGRFDIKIELGKFNNQEIKELLGKIFADIASKDELNLLNTTIFEEEFFTPCEIINIAIESENLLKTIERLKK